MLKGPYIYEAAEQTLPFNTRYAAPDFLVKRGILVDYVWHTVTPRGDHLHCCWSLCGRASGAWGRRGSAAHPCCGQRQADEEY